MSKHTALSILSGYRNHFVSNTTNIATLVSMIGDGIPSIATRAVSGIKKTVDLNCTYSPKWGCYAVIRLAQLKGVHLDLTLNPVNDRVAALHEASRCLTCLVDYVATGTRDNDITNKFSMLCLYQAAIAAEMLQYKEDNK